ncbi:MAG: response regulator transcription factor [Desulfobacteraceae bacterium]|nr:response regulator transcription factor [Desulfobacteraceae bacterium]
MKKVKIILVDDHSLLQHGLCKSLEVEKEFEVIAKTGSGRAAIELVNQHSPDLVIMDISMPGLNGMEATKQIITNNPEIKVVALSMHMEKIYIMGMMSAGAAGYVLKSCSFKELLKCIKTVLAGKLYLCGEVRHMIDTKNDSPINDSSVSIFSILSKREREVLQLIAEGHKSKEIAGKLNISIKTVDIHRTNLKAKLNVHSIAELTKVAITQGLTTHLL